MPSNSTYSLDRGWSRRYPTLAGTPLVSWVGRKVAASDHCVAIVKRCATCGETYIMHAGDPTDACEAHRPALHEIERGQPDD